METPREALKKIIEANNLTHQQAASDNGCQAAQVWRWTSGRAEPRHSMRLKIEAWSEGLIPAFGPWNAPLGDVPIPAPLPEPDERLCWASTLLGMPLDRMRRATHLPNLVAWKHLARQLNVETADDVKRHFEGMGYLVIEEQQTLKEGEVTIMSPCTPLLPSMRPV